MELIRDNDLYIILGVIDQYVSYITENRDESHGIAHMRAVLHNTLKILDVMHGMTDMSITKYACIVALIHDVCDHKYDKTGSLRVRLKYFLLSLDLDADTILNIVDNISYSKQNNAILAGTPIDFISLLGETNALVRDIVSDADKMEALGNSGLGRCVEFTIMKMKQEGQIDFSTKDFEECLRRVKLHSDEKLLKLYDNFIVTDAGKILCKPLHEEFIRELDNLLAISEETFNYLFL